MEKVSRKYHQEEGRTPKDGIARFKKLPKVWRGAHRG
jgi:hypothetical protein